MIIPTWKKHFFIISTVFLLILPVSSSAEKIGPILSSANTDGTKTVCIIPFEINSQKDISYIKSGIINMLNSRLSWKGKVEILPKNKVVKALAGSKQTSGNSLVKKIARKTGADYVVSGVITEFSGSYSIDTKVFNLHENSYLTFYGQSDSISNLIENADIIAAKINKKVFDRTTSSYEKFEKEKVITEEELRRMNPERMMPARKVDPEEDEPWWKIW